ncbi:MAG: adenine nucleotide alpha hydrolase [Alphaproteobacteria bacterium]|nr:adenine nucleotide alpha hydrolase [Alphaproteobacteria bacterium]MDP6815678.1 adenine nucleotide alpha hydrolase [Alphaproteobacteria bacterium]
MAADLARLSERLAAVLRDCGQATIAVSGGVDSMTLASFAHRLAAADGVRMVHAISPAVPRAATVRVRELAQAEGWRLDVVDAGEFADPRYRANPLDRCYFCKSNLYRTLGELAPGVVLSGTNGDDLGDFRPGLRAAAEWQVRHPYVEAGMAKADVRALARRLDLPDLAALPASPCLASRVETGIAIAADTLTLVDAVEVWARERLAADTVRCRVRTDGLVLELDPATLSGLTATRRLSLLAEMQSRFPAADGVRFAAYRRGSAFVGDRAAAG